MRHTSLGYLIFSWDDYGWDLGPENNVYLPIDPVLGSITSHGGGDYLESSDVYKEEQDSQDDFYDPYHNDPDIWDTDPPPPEPITYDPIPSVNNGEFSIFFVGYSHGSTMDAATYPYTRTENGRELFSYTIIPDSGGTEFRISDNIGDFSARIDEIIDGQFAALLTISWGRLIVKVWGGHTTEPLVYAAVEARKVTFYKDKIAGVGMW